jgi:hypothetical protein
MRRARALFVATAIAVLALAAGAARAQAPDSTVTPAPDAATPVVAPDTASTLTTQAIDLARALIRDGEYDRSIELLKGALATAIEATERRRELYLLLIKTYVFLGNDYKFRPQGREASNLNYQEARRLIAECLATPELRHTRPVPASDYPPEMLTFFDEARRQMFGAYRVTQITPPDAIVLFDGDTLRPAPGDTLLGGENIPIGEHTVVVTAKGHSSFTDRFTIAPDVTTERSYRLQKRRGPWWYATRGGAALGLVVGGVAALVGGGSEGTPPPEPLPGAPDPPN